VKVLLHICCGPCAIFPVLDLRAQGHDVAGFFCNPNIHPYQEYQLRRESAEEMSRQLKLPLLMEESYYPEAYFREVAFREGERCRFCYYLRLRETAALAKEKGFDGFTTTLLVSPWQNLDVIRQIGEQVGRDQGVSFFFCDWRPGYREGRQRAREMGLYSQKYCGCIFSERERFQKVKKNG
jgi:predicted adenine nucleotide alpha hydrolase (AANH) superfamily ATPase